MDKHFPSSAETALYLEIIGKNESELDVHDRLIFAMHRNIYLNEQKQILSHLLERAQIYNTLIVTTGYAAFFASWRFFADEYRELSPLYELSLLIMLLSVLFFVVWNVMGSIVLGRDLHHKLETMVRNNHDPVYMFYAIQRLDAELAQKALRRRYFWYSALIATILPATLSIIIFISITFQGTLNKIL